MSERQSLDSAGCCNSVALWSFVRCVVLGCLVLVLVCRGVYSRRSFGGLRNVVDSVV